MYLFFPGPPVGVSTSVATPEEASAVILTTRYELLLGSHFSCFICIIFNTFFKEHLAILVLEVTRGQKASLPAYL